ncbi:hypothetical protein ABZ372_55455, partial [Streptomyces sp. NPDC005921]
MTVSLPRTALLGGSLATVAALALSACGAAPDNASSTTSGGKSAATATSAADLGGMDKLIAAAKKEGTLQARLGGPGAAHQAVADLPGRAHLGPRPGHGP